MTSCVSSGTVRWSQDLTSSWDLISSVRDKKCETFEVMCWVRYCNNRGYMCEVWVYHGTDIEVAYSRRYATNSEYESCCETAALCGVAHCTVITKTAVIYVSRCSLSRILVIADLNDPYLPQTPPLFLSGDGNPVNRREPQPNPVQCGTLPAIRGPTDTPYGWQESVQTERNATC